MIDSLRDVVGGEGTDVLTDGLTDGCGLWSTSPPRQALEASLAEALARTATLEQGRAALEGRVRAMGDAARAALRRLAAHRSSSRAGEEEEEDGQGKQASADGDEGNGRSDQSINTDRPPSQSNPIRFDQSTAASSLSRRKQLPKKKRSHSTGGAGAAAVAAEAAAAGAASALVAELEAALATILAKAEGREEQEQEETPVAAAAAAVEEEAEAVEVVAGPPLVPEGMPLTVDGPDPFLLPLSQTLSQPPVSEVCGGVVGVEVMMMTIPMMNARVDGWMVDG